MAFHKSIAGKIRAGNKPGRAGFNAAKGGQLRRWAGTIPTAYWKVEGIGDSDTTLPDSSKRGLGLDGTLAGTISTVAGDTKTWNTAQTPAGSFQSLYFNGTDNKVTIPYNAALKFNNSIKKMSIAMWIKTSKNGDYFLISEEDSGTAAAGWVYCAVGVGTANKANVFWNTAVGASWRAGGTTVNDNTWHHIVYVYEGDNSLKIYVDGVLEITNVNQSGDLIDNEVPILLGYRRFGGADWYQYYMDEIAYWTDIALTEAQVKDLYNEGTSRNSSSGVARG